MSSAKLAEPSSGLSDDLVDLLRLQRRFLFQFRTPCHQDSIPAPFRMLVIAFLHNPLGWCRFPCLEVSRMRIFLSDSVSSARSAPPTTMRSEPAATEAEAMPRSDGVLYRSLSLPQYVP